MGSIRAGEEEETEMLGIGRTVVHNNQRDVIFLGSAIPHVMLVGHESAEECIVCYHIFGGIIIIMWRLS